MTEPTPMKPPTAYAMRKAASETASLREGYEILERNGDDPTVTTTYSLLHDGVGLGAYSSMEEVDRAIRKDRDQRAAQEALRDQPVPAGPVVDAGA